MPSSTWNECRLGEVLRIKHGYAFKGEFFSDSGSHIVLTPGNFFDEGGFKVRGEKDKRYVGPIPADYVLSRGDLLVVMTEQAEGLLGSPALIPESGVYLHNQRLGLVQEVSPAVADRRYLYYLFNSSLVRKQIRATANGAKVRHTSPGRICDVEVRLPPPPAQRKIAFVLSAYDDLIENNLRRIKMLEEMAQSLYKEWFVDLRFPGHETARMVESPLGMIPEQWRETRIDAVCSTLQSGGTPARARPEFWQDGTVDWYKTGELQDAFLFGAQEKISEEALTSSTARLFEAGTILMAIYGSPTVGRMGILVNKGSCNQAALGLVADNAVIDQLYLFFCLRKEREYLNGIAQGAAQQNISREKVAETLILLPDLQSLERFHAAVAPLWKSIRNSQERNILLRQTRDLLLPKLISGELDVSELDIDVGKAAS